MLQNSTTDFFIIFNPVETFGRTLAFISKPLSRLGFFLVFWCWGEVPELPNLFSKVKLTMRVCIGSTVPCFNGLSKQWFQIEEITISVMVLFSLDFKELLSNRRLSISCARIIFQRNWRAALEVNN